MIINKEIFGALIGLARTTDGNEHLINENATAVILECLRDHSETNQCNLLEKIDSIKFQMVPDCYACACPCGKYNAYDISSVLKEQSHVNQLKRNIMDLLIRFAQTRQSINSEEEMILYRSLILLGIDEPSEEILHSYQTQLCGIL